jgi:hypothetical protein
LPRRGKLLFCEYVGGSERHTRKRKALNHRRDALGADLKRRALAAATERAGSS